MRYRTNDGVVFTAKTHKGIVSKMRRAAWLAPGKVEYMREVSERVADLRDDGVTVFWDQGAKIFLAGLVALGFMSNEY